MTSRSNPCVLNSPFSLLSPVLLLEKKLPLTFGLGELLVLTVVRLNKLGSNSACKFWFRGNEFVQNWKHRMKEAYELRVY